MIDAYSLETVMAVARELSPFYGDLYSGVPATGWTLADLPVVDQKEFWEANTVENNRVLTGPLEEGMVFKSGGTSGSPKFSVFSRREWETFCKVFGSGFASKAIQPGDRAANLFYVGELYCSFLFATFSAQYCDTGFVQYPVAGNADFDYTAHACSDLGINVLLGVPTTLVGFAEHVEAKGVRGLGIDRAFFGGENMYDDQRAVMERVFPGIEVRTIGYASVDAGLLGYGDRTCGPSEHRVFGTHTILEIVDEDTGETIEEPGRTGKVLATNLTRLLMPIIRYPAGDRAAWVEEPGVRDRKFVIQGRSEEGARVGPATLYVEDMRKVLHPFMSRCGAANFQIVVTHEGRNDGVILRIATQRQPEPELAPEIVSALYRDRPMLKQLVDNGFVRDAKVEFVSPEELITNRRTGKLRLVVDNRHGG